MLHIEGILQHVLFLCTGNEKLYIGIKTILGFQYVGFMGYFMMYAWYCAANCKQSIPINDSGMGDYSIHYCTNCMNIYVSSSALFGFSYTIYFFPWEWRGNLSKS